ncbi:MAG: polysaccharide biosynthesis C-terminal domain-containing protein [Deinococcales bacterium]
MSSAFLTLPAGLMLWLLGDAATLTVFNWMSFFSERGADPEVMRLSQLALAPLAFAVFPLGLNHMLTRVLYIRRQVKLASILTIIVLTSQAILYYLLAKRMGIAGLSLATALVAWGQWLFLMLKIAQQEALDLRALSRRFVMLALAGLLSSALTYGALYLVPDSRFAEIIRLLLGALVFALSYGLICWRLKIPEMKALLKFFS